MMAVQTRNPGLRSAAGVALFLCLFSLLDGSPAAAAKAASKKPAATFQLPKVRLVAISTPVAMATVRASKKPVSIGTVSYLIGDYRTSYDVLVTPRRDGGLVYGPATGQEPRAGAGHDWRRPTQKRGGGPPVHHRREGRR